MPDVAEILDRLMARIEYNAHGLEEGDFVRVEYVRNFVEDEKRRAATAAACVFCDIASGTAPATIVEEWPDAIAIVPLGPVVDGHILVIPRQHVTDFAASPDVTAATMRRAAEYAAARHDSANVITSMGRAATQSIDHLHVHVVPRAVDDQLMVPWGTIYGDNPQAPHWCRVAQALRDEIDAKAMPCASA